MADLDQIRLGLEVVGVFLVPGVAFYVRSEVDKRLTQFELAIEKRLGELSARDAASDAKHINIDRRIGALEGNYQSIISRQDQQQTTLNHIAGRIDMLFDTRAKEGNN